MFMSKKRESPFHLRTATIEDLNQCVELALKIPEENDLDFFPKPDKTKVNQVLSELINNNTLIVYENNETIVGIFGVIIDTFWWTSEEMMTDVIFYIKPEFRSYNAYKRLLSAGEAFAKINKLPLALLFFTTKDTKRKFEMIKRRGYKPVGFWVMKKDT